MTPKQERFVQEYLIDLNASAAYRRAGYSSGNPDVNGPRLLGKAGIQAAVQAARAEREEKTKINAEYVLRGASELFERCMQKVPVMVFDRVEKEWRQETAFMRDEDTGETREVGVWKFDATGAAAALNILGRHTEVQAFKDRQEIEHKGGVTFLLPQQFKDEAEWEAQS